MNMNHEPMWAQETSECNPIPRWARWLAVALIFAGYGALEYQDHITEQTINPPKQGAAQP